MVLPVLCTLQLWFTAWAEGEQVLLGASQLLQLGYLQRTKEP